MSGENKTLNSDNISTVFNFSKSLDFELKNYLGSVSCFFVHILRWQDDINVSGLTFQMPQIGKYKYKFRTEILCGALWGECVMYPFDLFAACGSKDDFYDHIK